MHVHVYTFSKSSSELRRQLNSSKERTEQLTEEKNQLVRQNGYTYYNLSQKSTTIPPCTSISVHPHPAGFIICRAIIV